MFDFVLFKCIVPLMTKYDCPNLSSLDYYQHGPVESVKSLHNKNNRIYYVHPLPKPSQLHFTLFKYYPFPLRNSTKTCYF